MRWYKGGGGAGALGIGVRKTQEKIYCCLVNGFKLSLISLTPDGADPILLAYTRKKTIGGCLTSRYLVV